MTIKFSILTAIPQREYREFYKAAMVTPTKERERKNCMLIHANKVDITVKYGVKKIGLKPSPCTFCLNQ